MTPPTAQARALRAEGQNEAQIAMHFDCSVSTIRRVLAGPAPDAGTARIGRPPAYELPPELIRDLALSARATTTPRRTRNTPVAMPLYLAAAREDPRLPAALRERILAGKAAPERVKADIRQWIGADQHSRARGTKHAALDTVMTPRDNSYIDADGQRVAMLAGDFFNADDMHSNIPFWTEGDDPGEDSVRAFGVRVARAQILAAQDFSTLRFLSHTVWAMRTDGYGSYAILWFFKRLMADVGVPRRGWKLEHGAWASNAVREALAALGMHVEHAQTAKGKRIEMSFHQLQVIMSETFRGRGLDLGRLRGEFQDSKKLWLDMRAGKIDPRTVGVPHISELSAAVAEAVELYNNKVSNGELLHGRSPMQAWEEDFSAVAAAPLRKLTAAEEWLLAPQKSTVSLRDGLAKATHKTFGQATWWYANAELFAALNRGYKVTVRFDVADPARAAIYSAEGSTERKKSRAFLLQQCPDIFAGRWTPGQLQSLVAEGEFLGYADLFQRAPAFVMAAWENFSQGHDYRKRYVRCVRAIYRGGSLSDERHDGAGASRRLEGAVAAPVLDAEPVAGQVAVPGTSKAARVAAEAEEAVRSSGAEAPMHRQAGMPALPSRAAAATRLTQRLFGSWDDPEEEEEDESTVPAPLTLDDVPY